MKSVRQTTDLVTQIIVHLDGDNSYSREHDYKNDGDYLATQNIHILFK